MFSKNNPRKQTVVLGYFIATADYATLFGRQGQGSIYQELERGHDGIAVKSGGDCFSRRGAAEEVSMAQQSGISGRGRRSAGAASRRTETFSSGVKEGICTDSAAGEQGRKIVGWKFKVVVADGVCVWSHKL